jgi:hypothetical protein
VVLLHRLTLSAHLTPPSGAAQVGGKGVP